MATAPGATMPEEYLADVYEVPVQVSLWQDAWRRVRRNRFALLGFSVIVLFIVVAAVSIFWTPYSYYRQAIGPTYQGLSLRHLLGLDQAGRDILSRIMVGARISLEVGIGSAAAV